MIFFNIQLVILLIILQVSSNRTQWSIKYVGAKIWNNIPSRFKQFFYPKFRFLYKQYQLEKY